MKCSEILLKIAREHPEMTVAFRNANNQTVSAMAVRMREGDYSLMKMVPFKELDRVPFDLIAEVLEQMLAEFESHLAKEHVAT